VEGKLEVLTRNTSVMEEGESRGGGETEKFQRGPVISMTHLPREGRVKWGK